jgi:hypothetical protein
MSPSWGSCEEPSRYAAAPEMGRNRIRLVAKKEGTRLSSLSSGTLGTRCRGR